MNKLMTLQGFPKLHETPLAKIYSNMPCLSIECDDSIERRINIQFKPYQAFRLTTCDCFNPPGDLHSFSCEILEVEDSSWIGELSRIAKSADQASDFMEKSRHFILPLQDEFLEVAAWDIEICYPIEK